MAVYTELSVEEIKTFLTVYTLPPLSSAEGIRAGVENTNYLLTLGDGSKYILTLFERRLTAAELPFFADLMQFLSLRSVPCPLPVAARDGSFIHLLKNKPVLIVTFLTGQSAVRIEPPHLHALGDAMGRMHKAAQGFIPTRVNALGPAGWQASLDAIGDRADTIAPGLMRALTQELRWLADHWPKTLPQGVIHGDLFPDNVFFDAHAALTGIIDFYLACNDFLAYDLAICLNSWCFEHDREFNITKAKAMLRAYHAVRPISEEELASLPILARGAALSFLLLRAHHHLFPAQDALVTPKDPLEYLRKLRFHQSVKHHKEYGL